MLNQKKICVHHKPDKFVGREDWIVIERVTQPDTQSLPVWTYKAFLKRDDDEIEVVAASGLATDDLLIGLRTSPIINLVMLEEVWQVLEPEFKRPTLPILVAHATVDDLLGLQSGEEDLGVLQTSPIVPYIDLIQVMDGIPRRGSMC